MWVNLINCTGVDGSIVFVHAFSNTISNIYLDLPGQKLREKQDGYPELEIRLFFFSMNRCFFFSVVTHAAWTAESCANKFPRFHDGFKRSLHPLFHRTVGSKKFY